MNAYPTQAEMIAWVALSMVVAVPLIAVYVRDLYNKYIRRYVEYDDML